MQISDRARGLRSALTALLAAAVLVLSPAVTPSEEGAPPVDEQGRPTYVPGEVLVQLRPGSSVSALGGAYNLLADPGASRPLGATLRARAADEGEVLRVKTKPGVAVGEAMLALRADPAVLTADPNYLNYRLVTPTDALYGQLWGMKNTGQTISDPQAYSTNNPGTAGVDVDAETAWDTATGTGVLVAVIDDGVDFTNPDLIGKKWPGSGGTCPGGGSNTLYGGCDFADGDNDPMPINFYHGTHVAGTIGASKNTEGVVGIAYEAPIMALKVFPDDGTGAADSAIIDAIYYAYAAGADIANLSLGRGGAASGTMTTAVNAAIAGGMLLVVAAGNEFNNNDLSPRWPANYAKTASTSAGVISVAATDQSDAKANFSNYGATTVNVGAPGVNIISSIWDRTVIVEEKGDSAVPGNPNLTDCASGISTCFNGTIFDANASGGNDCEGTNCQWGTGWGSGLMFIVGNITPTSGSQYGNNVDGTIITDAFDTSTYDRVVLRYLGGWDLECGFDYLDVEVYNGSTWQRLLAPNYNINDTLTNYCPSTHTHTGAMYPVFASLAEISHDITAYKNANMRVRFTFHTDSSIDSTIVTGGAQIRDVIIERLGGDSSPYGLLNGTSMAAPMVAGIAALVKQVYPAATPAQLKQVLIDTGEPVPSLSTITTSGVRVNAANAVAILELPPEPPASAGGGGGGCLITWATERWLPDAALNPLRDLRDSLWRSGAAGQALVRAYYRGSAALIPWLEAALDAWRPDLALPAGVTTRL